MPITRENRASLTEPDFANAAKDPAMTAPDVSVRPKTHVDMEKGLAQPENGEKQAGEPEESGGATGGKGSAFRALGWLDRLLALWIFLAMAIGIILGNFVPNVGTALQQGQFVDVSIPIAVGLLVMMYPILCKVRYESLHHVFAHREIWKQIGFSIVINWIVAPFFMVGAFCTGITITSHNSRFILLIASGSLAWPGPFSLMRRSYEKALSS